MATIYDIAKKTGFSITTVSKVLNNYSDVSEKTRKLILAAVEELDYYPSSSARTLTTKKSWTIGVVFIDTHGMEHPFFNAVIESFRKKAEKSGYDLLFASNQIGNDPKTYIDHFQYRGVDGVVIFCSVDGDPEIEKLIKSKIPTVLIDLESRESSVVYSDNEYGSHLAVEYLHSLGHEKIAHISGHKDLYVAVQRLNGFLNAMRKYNLDVPDDYIVDGGFFHYEGGQKAMRQLLKLKELPTAVYVAGDLMALGAISEIKKNGLNVPEDISVIGFDDIKMVEYTTPALTTLRQDTALMGKTAANLLIDQINNKTKQCMSVKIPVHIIERESCRSIK
ncbi:LacI family transcriptional regulator [Alkalihalobacillus sp. MEB130]|uniref:LacI family DNA-binding transcriptional regulator n=1 Tax=Alkalihalobacillus sp. MEB130 TaxID=2976704 RepID=UPI0028DDE702|nr:LacI family DNA-binding transcriptional regulator [Alkalihalobacillus sp. MEB130]MDT8862938.1 LacI family transcriptional regulator [Alkalihalobacillus sp. MEB130]